MYIILLLGIAVILSLLRICFQVEYHRRDQDDKLTVQLSLLRGLVQYRAELPTIELKQRFFTPVLKMTSEMKKVAFHPVEDKEFIVGLPITARLIRRLPAQVKDGWHRFNRFNPAMYYLFRFIRCRRFHWRTEIGLDDAAYTGIMVGVLWGIKTFLYKNLQSKVGIMSQKPAIQVVPDFFHKKMILDFSCIFDIRIGHIIIAGLNFVRKRY